MLICPSWADFWRRWQALHNARQRNLVILPECQATYEQCLPACLEISQTAYSPLSRLSSSSATLVNVLVNLLPEQRQVVQASGVPTPSLRFIKAVQARQQLGSQHGLLVYRAVEEFDLNAWYALCGTITGLACLILPEAFTPTNFSAWSQTLDKQAKGYGYATATQERSFVSPWRQWWPSLWQQDQVIYLSPEVQGQATKLQGQATKAEGLTTRMVADWPLDQHKIPTLLPEQQQFVQTLWAFVHADQPGVLWLTGARGRGKTTAVLAGLRQLKQANISYVITGASQSHVKQHLGQGQSEHLVAVDKLIENAKTDDTRAQHQATYARPNLIVVEEAASLPLSLLQALLRLPAHLLLVSTQEGYEGTGHGLRLQLPKLADTAGRQVHISHLTQAMRWADKDPLETLLNKTLGHGLATQVPAPTSTRLEALHHKRLTGVSLAANTPLRLQIFALLSLAHYQTTPQDLRLLMDHPSMEIHAWLTQTGACVGVACVLHEGHLSSALAQQIAQGQRRVVGHVLPQILAQQAGLAPMASHGYKRIQRIALHPDWQAQGWGVKLVKHLVDGYQAQAEADWLGVSFAAEPYIVRFWIKCGFRPAWGGLRAHKATGLYSLQMLLPISQLAQTQLSSVHACWFYQHTLLHKYWRGYVSKTHAANTNLRLTKPSYRCLSYWSSATYDPSWQTRLQQVAHYQGNIFSITGYLVQQLSSAPTLSDQQQQWLQDYHTPTLSYATRQKLTRSVAAEWLMDWHT